MRCDKPERNSPPAAHAKAETLPASRACSPAGFRAHNPPPKAPACDPPKPTTARPATAPDPPNTYADAPRPAAQSPNTNAGKPDSVTPTPAAANPRATTAAAHTNPPGWC